ncbi:F-box/kelch-repeat protein At3g06240-like [Apium graveolens]|uniref:F-box/kelch-repeat protein At3g06240-like n=1 Tax=Apium graveolens TaxID=4045 RepID=UPI003D79E1DD
MFVTLHFNHQTITTHDNAKYLFVHDKTFTSTHEITLRYDDAQCEEYCTFDYPLDFNIHEWYALSNGLVCMSSMLFRAPDYVPNIYLWNPVVGIYKMIQVSPLSVFTAKEIEWTALAFGFRPEVNDYVVVHIVKLEYVSSGPDSLEPDVTDSNTVVIGVYSLNAGSWKTIAEDDVEIPALSTDRSVFVNGIAFWIGDIYEELRQVVMYFDTKTKILRELPVPHCFGLGERQLLRPTFHPFGQSIAYYVENNESHQLDMWILNGDLIDKFSWEKKMSVSLSENIWADVLGIRNNNEPILAKSNNLISYDLETHEPYDFVRSYDRLTSDSHYNEGSKPLLSIFPFVETLLWLDKKSSMIEKNVSVTC